MPTEYTPNDPLLPLVLPQFVFQREIYEPVSALVNYVNALFREGYSPDTLRQDLVDMYALDFYDAQVSNGGHSQFIHNSFEHIETGMERASRAARMIGLPEIANLVDQCAAFCRNNPDLAAEQDGFANRADDLDKLDKAFGTLNYTHEERSAFLDTLPPGHCDDLRDKFRLDDLDETLASVVAEVERLLPTKTAEEVAKDAAALTRPFYEKKISKVRGPAPSQYKDREVEREIGRLATCIRIALLKSTPDDRIRNVTAQASEKMLDPGLYDLTRYHIHAAAWIAQHPHLELAPSDEWESRVESIAAASPFANLEKQRRELDRVTRAMPDDIQIAVASAMAMLARPGCNGPFLEDTQKRVDLSPRYQDACFAKTSDGDLFLCKTANRVVLHEVKENWRFGLAKQAVMAMYKLGMVHEFDVLGWPKPIPFARPPGTPQQSALMGGILNRLRSFPARVTGKCVGHSRIVSGLAELMQELHVPEAYMQWSDHASRMAYFQRGILKRLEADTQRLVWQFPHADEVHQMVAGPEFVEFSVVGHNRKARYPADELSKLRSELSPPSR